MPDPLWSKQRWERSAAGHWCQILLFFFNWTKALLSFLTQILIQSEPKYIKFSRGPPSLLTTQIPPGYAWPILAKRMPDNLGRGQDLPFFLKKERKPNWLAYQQQWVACFWCHIWNVIFRGKKLCNPPPKIKPRRYTLAPNQDSQVAVFWNLKDRNYNDLKEGSYIRAPN